MFKNDVESVVKRRDVETPFNKYYFLINDLMNTVCCPLFKFYCCDHRVIYTLLSRDLVKGVETRNKLIVNVRFDMNVK